MYSPSAFAASRYDISRPSSALLKAILVSSTFPLTQGYKSGTYSNPVTLSDFYGATSAVADSTAYALGTTRLDFTQGFGHVRTSNVFDVTGRLDTFLYEDELSEYSSWVMSYEVTNTSTDVIVTLVWNDPPGSLGCGYTDGGYSATCLIHDLDLKLFQSGTQVYSNFGGATAGSYSGEYDTVNNVEKITLEAGSLTQGEIIDVEVVTNGLSYADRQKFAVVITGNLKSSTPSPTVTPPPSTYPSILPLPAPTQLPRPSPTPVPMPVPSPLPFPDPTHLPSSVPSSRPVPAPSPAPLPIPSTQPIPLPSSLLIPSPTEVPVIAPSADPTSSPSFLPLPVPSSSPSNRPSYIPSSKPTHVPRPVPSPQPSLTPTVTDTVSAAVSMSMKTSVASLTSSQKSALRSTIAQTLDLDTENIRDFVLTISRRRRHLLTSYTMAASFTVVTELSKTSSSSAADFSSTISTSLAEKVATNIAQDASLASSISEVDTSSIIVVPATRRPSMVPTSAPTLEPSTGAADESVEDDSKSRSLFLDAAFIGGIAGAILLLPALFFSYRAIQLRHSISLEVAETEVPQKEMKRVNPINELRPLPRSSLDRTSEPPQSDFYSQGDRGRECTL